jgi:hypothetical protein
MLGRDRGIDIRIAERSNAASHTLSRSWCCAQQFDLVVSEVVQAFCEENWYSTPTALIGYLQRDGKQMSEGCDDAMTVSWQSPPVDCKTSCESHLVSGLEES